MSDTLNLANSIWPNGMKVDSDGHAVFYPLGTNKVEVPTSSSEWPKGNKLVSPFVYDENDKLVGFADTKAMTASEPTTIHLPYTHVEVDFSAIDKGMLTITAPNASVKKVLWSNGIFEDIVEINYKYKGCKTVDDVMAVDSNYQTTDIVNGVWSERLDDLEQGERMFYYCTNLSKFSPDLSSLTNGYNMFNECYNLESFSSDLSSIENGREMFYGCNALTAFSSDLPNLTNGLWMFLHCKLDTASVQNIADTIKDVNALENENECSGIWKDIYIGIGNSKPNEQEESAFNTIASKGWAVYVNGSYYTPTSPAAITTLDETGKEITIPIPFWAKPIQTDEEHAKYVDEQGNFFNILGAQFIYVDDPDTYGMFTCEADAAANMRLTPYIKPIEN